jgi:2,4-dienoyl-CoA reductase-like NADH-dependent reductase (Old Yellow Enzyme family)
MPITRFLLEHDTVPAVQLAHAGRKARVMGAIAPSPIAYADMPQPQEMSASDIAAVINAFQRSAALALTAGFRVIEIHAAHGYLLHEFLSPLSNQRNDGYGGSFEGRIHFLLEVVRGVRAFWPERYPLFVRISATDWVEGGWDLEQSVELARRLKGLGVDLIDVSSGGLSPDQQVTAEPGYQVPFAERIKHEADIATAAVGLITRAAQAEDILCQGRADAILIGRQSLRDPYWPLRAARELGYALPAPVQYERAWQ